MTTAGLPDDQHDFGMAMGHSPVAHKVVCVDFDGTLVPWGPLMGDKDLLPGAARALMALQELGCTVVIWTSRVSEVWARSVIGPTNDLPGHYGEAVRKFLAEQRAYVIETIHRGAPDFIVGEMTCEKVPAQAYIDDKAVAFNGDWDDALAETLMLLEPQP